MSVLLGLSRWRWNPVEVAWEVDAGLGWHASKLMAGMTNVTAAPVGGELVLWKDTHLEPRRGMTDVQVAESLPLEEELFLSSKRKVRSDKGKRRKGK